MIKNSVTKKLATFIIPPYLDDFITNTEKELNSVFVEPVFRLDKLGYNEQESKIFMVRGPFVLSTQSF